MVLPVSFLGYSWTPAAERYVYLASIGFAVGVSFLAFEVLAGRPRWSLQTVQIMILLLIFVFGVTTARRAKVWQSNLTMMEDTLAKSPDSGKVTYAYGWALSSAGRIEEGITYWKKAIDLGYISEPSRMLGQVEEARGNYDEAEQYFLQALWPIPKKIKSSAERSPEKGLFNKRDPEIYLQLARMHRRMAEEMPEEADYHHKRMIHYHEAAHKLKPDDAYLEYLLAKAYLHFGDPAEARKLFAQVSRLAPDTYYGKAAAKLARVVGAKSRQVVK
jgi:tetratricopeptide (TPR) repeat protein